MAEHQRNLREKLLMAGIQEINSNGVHNFSVRRVARICGVSCAAPYKYFRDKQDFLAGIIEYVNAQWAQRQEEILADCGDSLRQQLVEVSVGYVAFLMEKPCFRSILMLKDEQFDNLYHRARGQLSSRSQDMLQELYAKGSWDEETFRWKLHQVRALMFGSVFLFDAGEMPYNAQTLARLRRSIDREFDLP